MEHFLKSGFNANDTLITLSDLNFPVVPFPKILKNVRLI